MPSTVTLCAHFDYGDTGYRILRYADDGDPRAAWVAAVKDYLRTPQARQDLEPLGLDRQACVTFDEIKELVPTEILARHGLQEVADDSRVVHLEAWNDVYYDLPWTDPEVDAQPEEATR